MNIAFIGVGVMGNPICTNLVRQDCYKVFVFDTEPARIDNLEMLGAVRTQSIAEAVAQADLVMTSLPGPAQVEAVAFSEHGLFDTLSDDGAWIDLSTNNLEVCNRITQKAEQSGVSFLDCPVSGGDEGATAGTLTILVGGDQTVYQQYLPVLKIIGSNITHLGKNGAGYSAKISQVILCYLHSLALSEALMLGIKGGVEPRQMLRIIQNSTGKSYVADRYGPPILDGDYDPSFTVGLALKDMKLAGNMAANLGISLPMCDLTMATYDRAQKQYGFDANHLKVVKLLEEDNDTSLRG